MKQTVVTFSLRIRHTCWSCVPSNILLDIGDLVFTEAFLNFYGALDSAKQLKNGRYTLPAK